MIRWNFVGCDNFHNVQNMQKSCFAENSLFLTIFINMFSLEEIFPMIFSPQCFNCNSLSATYPISWDILPWGYSTIGFHKKNFVFPILPWRHDVSGNRGPITSRTPAKEQPLFPLSGYIMSLDLQFSCLTSKIFKTAPVSIIHPVD